MSSHVPTEEDLMKEFTALLPNWKTPKNDQELCEQEALGFASAERYAEKYIQELRTAGADAALIAHREKGLERIRAARQELLNVNLHPDEIREQLSKVLRDDNERYNAAQSEARQAQEDVRRISQAYFSVRSAPPTVEVEMGEAEAEQHQHQQQQQQQQQQPHT